MRDLDACLDPISDAAPSGEDLEYDADFIALEMASKPGEERVIGDAVIPAEDPDYAEVRDLAEALLTRSRDLRVAVLLSHAVLQTDGLAAFGSVLGYIRDALERYWDSVHPQIDEEDGDPTMRVNAVLGLTGRDTVLRALRATPLAESRAFGRFGLRDIEIAFGELAPSGEDGPAPDAQTVQAAFRDMDSDALTDRVETAAALVENVRAIAALFDDHVGAAGPDLDPLLRVTQDIHRRLAAEAPTDDPAPDDRPVDPVPASAQAVAPAGAIGSPAEVKAALDRIIDYYARVEPSSPLPILLTRAKRLVSADFVTIMRDMAPEGVNNIALIGGFEPDEGHEGTHDYE